MSDTFAMMVSMRYEIPAPMLAKAVTAVPTGPGYSYEPKWDGFRGLVAWDGESVEIGSRGAKPLTRYFPELVDAFSQLLPRPCLLDGEIVVATGDPKRLDWEALSQRIHPAASRVAKLAAETPAMFIAYDLLADGDDDLQQAPFAERRARLVELLRDVPHPVHVTRATSDPDAATEWFERFEGAGLDGVVAKPLDQPYAPGKRTMLKIKHSRTADVVALGYRVHKSGQGVGSILVGLYTEDGDLVPVGGVSAFTDKRRLELVDELDPLVERDADGQVVTAQGESSRFQSGRDNAFVPLRPERVLEVKFDQMEGWRFRHTVQLLRWRPDRDPRSCTYTQLEVVNAYDLADVLE
jgi:ATP-dependent DNA ligase